MLNLSEAAYGHYERDLCLPDIKTLKNIAMLFNTTTDYLLGISEERNANNKIFVNERDYQFALELKELIHKYYRNQK